MRVLSVSIMAAIAITAMCSFGVSLHITSPAFTPSTMMPAKYSCEGQDINPPLQIANLPAGTKTIAIVMHDPDAPMKGGFTHWVAWNLPINELIPENYKLCVQGLNGAKQNGYKGMCPPSGTHHYHFMVYALDVSLNLDKNTDKDGLEKAMRGHVLGEGELIGLYKKGK